MKNILQHLGVLIWPTILLAVILCGSLFETTGYRPGPMMAARKGAVIYSVFNQKDTIFTKLAQGDSVRFLGYKKAHYDADFLVETTTGVRGWICPWMLDIDFIGGSKAVLGDTFKLGTPSKVIYNSYGPHWNYKDPVIGVYADGSPTVDLKSATIYPAIKDFGDYELRTQHSFSKIMSVNKFKKLSDKLTLTQSEDKLGPIENAARRDNGDIDVRYHTYVFNPADGNFYNPIVTFGADSVAVATSTREATDRSDWVLKYIPLASEIYDLGLTSFFARTDIYDSNNDTGKLMSTGKKVWYWACVIVGGIGALLWLFAACSFPVALLIALLYIPKIFYPLSDTAVKVLTAVVTAIFTYYWLVVMLGWGAYWWLVPIVIYVTYFLWDVYTVPLEDTIPHARCQKCRWMYTMELIDKDFLESKNSTENTSKSHKIGGHTRRWQTWTQVTQGNSSWKEDVKDHYETETHWRRDHYLENVRYDYYMLHYQCTECGHREKARDSVRVVLDRKFQGSSNYTTYDSSDN